MSIAKSRFFIRLIKFGVSLCLFAASTVTNVICQTETPNPQRGFYAGGSYAASDIEAVNAINGNLALRIPLASLPPGRGGLTAGVSLTYNSKLWDSTLGSYSDIDGNPAFRTVLMESQEGGWHYDFQYVMKNTIRPEYLSYYCGSPESQNIHKLQIRFPDGSLHDFAPLGYGGSHGYYRIEPDGYQWNCTSSSYTLVTTGTMTYYSTDGTFLRLDVQHDSGGGPDNNPWTLYFPDGSRVTGNNGPQRITDRNGNYIEFQNITYNTHPTAKIVDQSNRCILIEYASTGTYIHQWGVNNTELITTITGTTINSNTRDYDSQPTGNPTYSDIWQYLPATSGVSQITLPAEAGGLSYTFGYSHGTWDIWYGEVTSVVLPSGAELAYSYGETWGNSYLAVQHNRVVSKSMTYDAKYDGSTSSVIDTWHYNLYYDSSGIHSDITAPDGGVTRQWFKDPDNASFDWEAGLVYKTERPDGSVIEQLWHENIPYQVSTGVDGARNPFVQTEFTSLKNASGSLDKTAIKNYAYDKNGNVTQVDEYDWVNYGDVTRASGKPTGIPSGATLKRETVNTYYSPTPDASNSTTDDSDVYHKSTSPGLRTAIESTEIRSGASSSLALSRTEFVYDNSTTTGNLTEQKAWDSIKGSISRPLTSSNWIRILVDYNSYGNPTFTTDANGVQTRFYYDSINGVSDLYPTRKDIAYNYSALTQTTTYTYDFSTGLVTAATVVDPNNSGNNLTSDTTYDPVGRPIRVIVADGKSEKSCVATVYSDSDRRVIVRKDLNAADDGKLVTIQHFDPLGRVRLSRQLESTTSASICTNPAFTPSADENDETIGIKSQTRYFAGDSTHPNGYKLTSNPYTGTSSSASTNGTTGWTRSKTDQVGRVVEVQTFSGTSLPAPWGSNSSSTGAVTTTYDANTTGVKDQADKQRLSCVNGLGQLTQVWEIRSSDSATESVSFNGQSLNGYLSSYTYDALGNLTGVSQRIGASGSNQTRGFTYSSLGRLTQSISPENGTITYTYDNNGNLLSKTDSRIVSGSTHVTATMTYDELNRVKTKSYNDGLTPAINYYYDAQSLPSGAPTYTHGASWGRLLAVTYGSSSSAGTYYGYDILGRVVTKVQRTDGINYTSTANYNKAGRMASLSYPSPSSLVVQNDFDDAGRISKIHGPSSSPYYAGSSSTVIEYAPFGALTKQKLGNGLIHTVTYNSRLQPTNINLGTSSTPGSALALTYTYGTTTTNNGNITSTSVNAGSQTLTQNFTYDALNRLASMYEPSSTLSENYNYDRYGNKAKLIGGGGGPPATSGSGTVTINGSEQSDVIQGEDECWMYGDEGCLEWHHTYETIYDTGSVSITVNGFTATAYYNGSSTAISIATSLTSSLNGGGSPVTASRSGATITLTATATGTSTNYTLSSSSTYNTSYFGSPSFTGTPSGSTLTGGADGSSGGTPDRTFTGNNQISGYTYDAVGNLTSDGIHSYVYDAENHMINVDSGSNGVYTYDGEGQRVKKSVGGLRMIYGIGGRLLIECDSTTGNLKKEYIYGVSGVLATIDSTNGTVYITSDHLGSTRMVTNSSGAVSRKFDYMPFGAEIGNDSTYRTTTNGYGISGDSLRQKFASYERDYEVALDFAQARYYNYNIGRFNSADPIYFQREMIVDPQRFNLYEYARNSPLKWVDPDGEQVMVAQGSSLDQLYQLVGGKDVFDLYFEIKNGLVTLRAGVDITISNKGVQFLNQLINRPQTFLIYLGADSETVAKLFAGTTNKDGSLNKKGKQIAEKFRKRTYLVGTKDRPLGDDPDGSVFAVLAINPATFNLVQTGVGSSGVETAALQTGVGQVVSAVSLLIHELAENLDFSINGTGAGYPAPDKNLNKKKATRDLYNAQNDLYHGFVDYQRAHRFAIGKEVEIRQNLGTINGGYASGEITRP